MKHKTEQSMLLKSSLTNSSPALPLTKSMEFSKFDELINQENQAAYRRKEDGIAKEIDDAK